MSAALTMIRPHPLAPLPIHWRTGAIDAYRQAEDGLAARLRADLGARLLALTGHEIAPEAMYVDSAARLAQVAIDGLLFRSQAGILVVRRPCVACGVETLSSAAITSVTDLGEALAVWEPRCQHCQPADPPEDW